MTTASNTTTLSEDDIYRTSTQYRLWSFSPEQLASRRRKTHEIAVTRAKQYLSEQENGGDEGTSEYLSEEEELRLVERYGEVIKATAKHLRWPSHACTTAIQYLKRFYLSNSCMTYPPKEIYKTALFLASKTEALHITVNRFSKAISADPEAVLAPEYKLMQALRFTLDIRQPARGLKGTLMEMLNLVEGGIGPVPGVEITDGATVQQALLELKAPGSNNRTLWSGKPGANSIASVKERIQLAFQAAKELLESAANLTDAYFLYTPSQMIFAALEIADTPLYELYLDTKLPTTSTTRVKILATVHTCAEMLAAYDPENMMNKDERAALEKKLEACRDPATKDLIKAHAAAKRNGAEEGKIDELEAKKRKLAREKDKKEMDDLFGPSLPGIKG